MSVPPITFDDMEKESKKLFSYDRLLQNSRSFANFGKRAGFDRKFSPHALRHSQITHLVESGANQVAIMERVGHSDPTITTKIYTHTTDNMRSRLVDLIDENQKKFWAKLSEK